MSLLKQYLEDGEKRAIVFALAAGLGLVCSFFGWSLGLPFDPAWIAIVLCGYPILKGAVVGLISSFDIKADVLVAIALVSAVFIGEIFAAGEVAFIMVLGSMLEERTVRKAREGIEKLVCMAPSTARVVRGGGEETVPADAVKVGDVVRVLPGETIPVDGVISSGHTAVDQSLMTGESLPVDKGMGDELFAGTVNHFGACDFVASKVGENSTLRRMIALVESADAAKAPIVRIMDRWATWIVVAALATALGTWVVTGEVIRAVTILVVFCPCALVLSTPTAIMAGIGNATRFGILISSGDALERLSRVTRAAFDKTGTLTYGRPEVVAVGAFGEAGATDQACAGRMVLHLAATAEQRSEHPLGRSVMRHVRQMGITPDEPKDFTMLPGRGVSVLFQDQVLLAGNSALMEESAIVPSDEEKAAAEKYLADGCSVIFLALGGRLAGLVALADTMRPDAARMVEKLHAENVKSTLLTGDNASAAGAIAAGAGISDVRSGLLPEDKVHAVRSFQTEGEKVCMVGDGINDAPALKAAYVGVAMGGVGSDIAVDAADVVFVRDDIKRLPHLFRLAKKTAATIVTNITLSMGLNFVTVTLAALGLMGPVAGALAHNAGALLVVLNSARLLGVKDTSEEADVQVSAAAPVCLEDPESARA